MKKIQNGFTLQELIVVIAIIGILTASLITVINPVAQIEKGRDARRKSDLRQIQIAVEQYRSDVGNYPPEHGTAPGPYTLGDCDSELKNPAGTITYLTIPCDPNNTTYNGGNYRYRSAGDSMYDLRACLERDEPGLENGTSCTNRVLKFTQP